jgi:hypothetical protein
MDMTEIAARLGLSGSRPVVRKATELRRLCDINVDSSVLAIVSNPCRPFPLSSPSISLVRMSLMLVSCRGEVCKGIISLEIAATK